MTVGSIGRFASPRRSKLIAKLINVRPITHKSTAPTTLMPICAPHTKRFWPMLFQFIGYIPILCRAVETARERTQVCRGWQFLRCVYFELPFATALRGSGDGNA